MPDEWFYIKEKKKLGPVTFAQLRDLASQGQLARSDMVMQGGSTKWGTAEAVAGLFPAAPAAPTVPAAPAGMVARAAMEFVPPPPGPEPEKEPPPDAPSPSELEVFVGATANRMRQHQGDLILLLGLASVGAGFIGILGLVLIGIFGRAWLFMLAFSLIALGIGVPAILKAGTDLHKMKLNLVDPAGEGQTGQGRLFAIIGAVLGGLGLLVGIVIILINVEVKYF
jgi:hypothetical protein